MSPDLRRVVRCDRPRYAPQRLVLCAVDGSEIVVMEAVVDRRPAVAFAATADRVITCSPTGLVIHAANDGRRIAEIPADSLDRVSQVAWPRGSGIIVALGRPKRVLRCYDVEARRLRWELPAVVRDLHPSRDGQRIAIRTTTYELRVYEVATGAAVPIEPPRGPVLAADRAATRAVVARSTRVELWDLAADRVSGSLNLEPIDDAATAAALVTASGGFVPGTELGRLLRFTPNSR